MIEKVILTDLKDISFDRKSLLDLLNEDKEYCGCLTGNNIIDPESNIKEIIFNISNIELIDNTIVGVVEFDSNNSKSIIGYTLYKSKKAIFKMFFEASSNDNNILIFKKILGWDLQMGEPAVQLLYEEGKEGIKPKSKYLDPIKNNSFGDRDFSEEKVIFKSIERNELNEDIISNSKEYTQITNFLINYENDNFINLGKNRKIKKNEIVKLWEILKKEFKSYSFFMIYDIITSYFNYDGTKFYSYLNPVDKQILYDELKERID